MPAEDITQSPEFERAYREADRALRVRYSKVGSLLSLVLVPAGSTLELFVYPHLFWPILQIRLLCDALTAPAFALHFTRFGRRHIRALSIFWVLLVQLAIAWMIYLSEGAMSPYYAGLNLVLVCVAVVLPFTPWEAAGICAATIAAYVAACHFHSGTPVEVGILYNNMYFLVTTSIVCVVGSHLTTRARLEDFRLRYELGIRNEELAQSYEKLSELDRLKSEFFANVSHELRTPITLIFSPIDDLLRGDRRCPEWMREPLTTARQNALRLLKLINELLEVIRLEGDEGDISTEPMDLSSFLPGMVDSVRRLAEAKDLQMELAGQESALVVRADPWYIEKVVLNLLTNAIKFTPSGGKITTRWRREGERAVVEVADTGEGIAPEDLPFIFDRFRQVDGSSTRRHQGLGVGLALAREITEKHGGSLTAESTLGEGTTMRMELPLADDSVEVPPEPREPAQKPDAIMEASRAADRYVALSEPAQELADAPLPERSGEATVLVVDDEPDMRRFLVDILSRDHHVVQASDGEAALAAAQEHRPQLVLLDLMMPGIDGLEVCKTIKEDPGTERTKVVILTARADERAKINALEHGADDFVLKPFSTMEVRTRVANLLRAAELEQDLSRRNVELEETLNQLKETESQLVQSEKMRALGTLSAGLLHEVNNPLNFALTAVQVARQTCPEDLTDVREMLDDVEEGMGRIRDIVSDLRTFAYPTPDQDTSAFRLGEALESAVRLVSHEMDGQSLVREVPDDLLVRGSKTAIVHLLVNLLMNASEALREEPGDRKPVIQVTAEEGEGCVRVSVRDNGPGVPEQDLEQVFDPFFTTRTVGEGLGLGLSICHGIVKNHGGDISIQSEYGEWTEVSFTLKPADGEV
jgi:signal transduction histidine kinase